jgi:transposase
VLDNAKNHNNELIKNAIIKSGNEYLFAIPYTPKTNNPIEAYFNQIKTYMKKNRKCGKLRTIRKECRKCDRKSKI